MLSFYGRHIGDHLPLERTEAFLERAIS